ncbi:MAG TPA: sterol desaturase family protein [Nocardioidaceae bacterium]|nr:sterol desaturase family protein [Nocardioidaceae bacterium]
MPRPSNEIGEHPRVRLRADEQRINDTRRSPVTLGQAWKAFLRHPSPWMIGSTLFGASVARALVGDWALADTLAPLVLIAAFPIIEWVIHVCILHWRPRQIGRVEIDSLLARKHREHHADPRDIPLVFIPWQVLTWLLPSYVVLAVFAFPRLGLGLTFLVAVTALMFAYEWTHFLVHSDYRPRTRAFRALWRNHRPHHYKNEHYWFTVTTAGTADRLFGTFPRVSEVETSPTVRALHAREQRR